MRVTKVEKNRIQVETDEKECSIRWTFRLKGKELTMIGFDEIRSNRGIRYDAKASGVIHGNFLRISYQWRFDGKNDKRKLVSGQISLTRNE